jgi:hypothetical protein
MGILRNRRVFGRALVRTLACAVWVGLLALSETGRGTVVSVGAETSAPEFAYSGDTGPGFWGGVPGWEACAGLSLTQRQSPIDIDHIIVDRHSDHCCCGSMRRRWLLRTTVTPSKRSTKRAVR